jgi:hypothetical protein
MPSTAGSMYGGDGYRRRDEQAGVLLPSVAAVAVAEEATAQARARQPGPSPLPFTNTRLRTYTQRVDQLAGESSQHRHRIPQTLFTCISRSTSPFAIPGAVYQAMPQA